MCKVIRDDSSMVLLVTNQSGIGRGYYGEADFWQLTDLAVAIFWNLYIIY